MRVFWAVVLVLLLAGGAAAFLVHPSAPPPNGAAVQNDKFTTDIKWTLPAKDTPAAPPASTKTPAAIPPTPPAPPVDFTKDLNTAINDAVNGGTHDAAPSTAAAKPAEAGVPFELPTTPAFPREKTIPAKAFKVGNEIVIDGKYHIKGAGTKDDPYLVPFDLLMSAADSYDPRKGLSKMPQRVAFLNEKWVKLVGYVAFPISSTDPKEMLVMFNQWDGCCIGVPPTAYDAVETKLAKAAAGDDKFITFGSSAGLFKVDPYVDNGWLLGLYTMEQAGLSDGRNDPISPKQIKDN